MKQAIFCLVFLSPFFAGTVHSQSQKHIWKLEQTYTGPVSDSSLSSQSETFGYAAEAFIPDCEVWLYGKLMPPVSSPDGGNEVGILITKSDGQITINSNLFFPADEREQSRLAISPELSEQAAIMEAAFSEFRDNATKSPDIPDAYIVNGILFRPGEDTQFPLEQLGVTVTATVLPRYWGAVDYVRLEFREKAAVIPIKPRPKPTFSDAEKSEIQLDRLFNSAVAICEPGTVILIGRAYRLVYPVADRDSLVDALGQIPDLAVQKLLDSRGEPMYESLTINGFRFHSDVIRDFVNAAER